MGMPLCQAADDYRAHAKSVGGKSQVATDSGRVGLRKSWGRGSCMSRRDNYRKLAHRMVFSDF